MLPPLWSSALDSRAITRLGEVEKWLEAEQQLYLVLPPTSHRYRAFELVAPSQVRVVIVGQDPYPAPGQANGLAFSVNRGVKIPRSLRMIYEELRRDVEADVGEHGDLTYWAEQGVLLLNSALSVQSGMKGSHAKCGWTEMTTAVLKHVAAQVKPVVFMLWGDHAKKYEKLISRDRHCVLLAGHPAPPRGYSGFLGRGHFSKANAFLEAAGRGAINWNLSGSQGAFYDVSDAAVPSSP